MGTARMPTTRPAMPSQSLKVKLDAPSRKCELGSPRRSQSLHPANEPAPTTSAVELEVLQDGRHGLLRVLAVVVERRPAHGRSRTRGWIGGPRLGRPRARMLSRPGLFGAGRAAAANAQQRARALGALRAVGASP